MKDIQKFILTIAILTIGVFGINKHLENSLISVPTVGAILGLLFLIWDKYIWRIKKLKTGEIIEFIVGLFNYPDLNGEWEIKYKSTYTPKGRKSEKYITSGKGTTHIKQSYLKLFINGSFSKSSNFESRISKLNRKGNGEWELVYLYQNKPVNEELQASKNGGMHEGFCYLTVKSKNKLEGYYVNDENRKTRGHITFKRLA